MAFKDNLREFIGNLGGFGPENLTRLQGLVRSDVPDFTTIRLSALLQGSPPRIIEVAGTSAAFRGKALTQNDLSEILNAFRPESELEDEMELFDLGDQ